MGIHVLPRTLRIAPSFPIEMSVQVNDATLLLALEWPVVERLLGDRAATDESVGDALLAHRHLIERTLRAHLFAQGAPLSGQVVLGLDDFRFVATD